MSQRASPEPRRTCRERCDRAPQPATAERASTRPIDVVCMGRAAVDLYGEQIGGRLEDMRSFAKYLGGSPANTAVGVARLGLRPAMLSRVGDEHNGRFVRERLAAEGVDVRHLRTDPNRLTALVFLGIRDRDTFPLVFYRDRCADMALDADDVDPALIGSAGALLLSGTHLSQAGTLRACEAAVELAIAAGTRVVLDIDYRPVLWGLTSPGLGEQRYVPSAAVSRRLQRVVPRCDLIVGTEEEIRIAGGAVETVAALRALRRLTAATLVLKRGPMGCLVFAGPIPETPRGRTGRAGLFGRGLQRARSRRRLHGRVPARLAARRAARPLLQLGQCLRRAGRLAPRLRAGHAELGRAAALPGARCQQPPCARRPDARPPAPRHDPAARLAGSGRAGLRPSRPARGACRARPEWCRPHRPLQAPAGAGGAPRGAGGNGTALGRPRGRCAAGRHHRRRALRRVGACRDDRRRLVDRASGRAPRFTAVAVRGARRAGARAACLAHRARGQVPRRAPSR